MQTNNTKSLLLKKGMSLMEVIVSLFILMILMIGIFSLIILSLRLAADNKFYVEAMEIANQKMEYIRNLPYDDVGTLTGSPAGVIPQDETIIREGAFDIHTAVMFHDDPYDSLQGAGDNVFIDYKIATVEVSWQGKYSSKNVTVFSKIIPNTEETLAGYGLMKLLIVNSMGAPIPYADIHIENANNGLDVDLSADGSGELTYPVLPDIESYLVRTTTAGYGVDQTHARTVENANPTKPHLSIFDGLKTEESFTIDQLAALQINTVSNTLFNNWQVNEPLNLRDHINARFSLDLGDNMYFSWQSQTATSSFVYVQKYDQAGTAQWSSDKKIYTTQFQNNADIVTSDAGDSFVVWNDNSANLKSITKSLSPVRFANLNKNESETLLIDFKPMINTDFTLLSYFDSSLQSLSTRAIDLGKNQIFKKYASLRNKIFKIKNYFKPMRTANAAGSITFVGIGTGDSTGVVDEITLDKPAGVILGDMLLAYIFMDDYSDGPITPPAGWSTLINNLRPSGSGSDARGAIFWKFANGGEPNNYDFEVSGAGCNWWFCWGHEELAGHIRAYRGVDPVSPFQGTIQTQSTISGDLLRPAPSHTVTTDNSMLVCGWGANTRQLGGNTPTFPPSLNHPRNNFADYISAEAADLTVNISDSPTAAQSYDANASIPRSSIAWSLVLIPEIIPDNVTVSSFDAQISSSTPGSSNVYIGGTFIISDNTGSHTVTDITITETGTINAPSHLSNFILYYDIDNTAPYDCASEQYDAGIDAQFGPSSSFDALSQASSTSAGGVNISITQALCLYPVLDISSSANKYDDIEIGITDPSTDVIIDSGNVVPSSAVEISGTTVINTPAYTELYHYRWRNDDGNETGASWYTDEDIADTVPINSNIRLRLLLFNSGSLNADPMDFRLEYGERITDCSSIASWVALPGDNSQDWKIIDSTNLTDGNPTTNISAGLTDPLSGIFVAGEIKDTDNQTNSITLNGDEFTEIEYVIAATSNANDSGYCFRVTDAGATTELNYTTYAEIAVVGDDNIYLLSLDSNGNLNWPVIRVNTDVAGEQQSNPRIALTENIGSPSTTIVWVDYRNSNADIYAQSIDANGNKAWGADLQITSSSTDEYTPSVAINSADEIIIAWTDNGSSSENIYMMKYDFNGIPVWANFVIIANSLDNEYSPEIAVDPSDNIYLSWEEDNTTAHNVFIAKYTTNGVLSWSQAANIENSTDEQTEPALTVNNSLLYASWTDDREGNQDIYAQKYDLSGTAQWSNDVKINVNTGSGAQNNSSLLINSTGDSFAVWCDGRASDLNIYATEFFDPLTLVNVANVPLIITGTKRIGENPVIVEYTNYAWTNGSGNLTLPVEYDIPGYSIEVNPASSSLNIIMRDPIQPLELFAGENKSMKIYVE